MTTNEYRVQTPHGVFTRHGGSFEFITVWKTLQRGIEGRTVNEVFASWHKTKETADKETHGSKAEKLGVYPVN